MVLDLLYTGTQDAIHPLLCPNLHPLLRQISAGNILPSEWATLAGDGEPLQFWLQSMDQTSQETISSGLVQAYLEETTDSMPDASLSLSLSLCVCVSVSLSVRLCHAMNKLGSRVALSP